MSHIALARKWRPQKFEDVIGQRGVVETLRNAIGSGRLAQSFIFAGPRGVGKTTTARILARALNCVNGPTADPCGECDSCREIAEGRDVDVLEIDGATYTGVDAVREVIVEPLSIAPMRNRYKIFIIDEVHRLSKNAFDALLKSVEEPPPYVKFMMATTELDSVPLTIQSRSQVFELKALPFGSIREQLRGVTGREGVNIDDGALALVARAAEGSMRDALSALDQVLAFTSQDVTAVDVGTVLGLVGRDVQFDVAEAVAREEASAVFTLAGSIVEAGFDLRTVCRELARLMRDLMVIRIDPSRLADPEIAVRGRAPPRMQALAGHYSHEDLMRAFDLLSMAERDIRMSSQPRHTFEMALLKWIHLRKLTPIEELIAGGPSTRDSVARSGSTVLTEPRATSRGSGQAAPIRPLAKPGPQLPSSSVPQPRAPSSASAPAELRRDKPPAPAVPSSQASPPSPPSQPSVKTALLTSIRESNKSFFGMVIAQAQLVEVDGDRIIFTFAPAHKNPAAAARGQEGVDRESCAQFDRAEDDGRAQRDASRRRSQRKRPEPRRRAADPGRQAEPSAGLRVPRQESGSPFVQNVRSDRCF